MDPPLTPWPASLPSSNKRETLLVESILGLNLVSWGFVNYVSCVSILLAETSSPDDLALVMGKARYDGENGVEPSKNSLTISFLLPLNQIPFSFYSLPCLGGLYG